MNTSKTSKALLVALLLALSLTQYAQAKPLSFAEKTKISKMSKSVCDYEEFKKSFKVQTGTFKVTILAKTVKELGIISSANSSVSGNPDGLVCSLASAYDCRGVDSFDFCKNSTFFVYSKTKSKIEEIKKLANGKTYIEAYVKVSKDKEMKLCIGHNWRDIISNSSGSQPAFLLDETMPVDRYELAAKPKTAEVIENVNFKALKADPDKTATYKTKCSIEIDDSYYGSFEKCKDTHYSFELYNESTIRGYMPKDEMSKAIFKKLSSCRKANAVVTFHFKHHELMDDIVSIDKVEFSE